MNRRIATARKTAVNVEDMAPESLQLMERHLIGLLTVVWEAQGVKKKIIAVESNYYQNGSSREAENDES